MNKTPEQKARDNIDKMLEKSGWKVVDKNAIGWAGPRLDPEVLEYQTDTKIWKWVWIGNHILSVRLDGVLLRIYCFY